MQQARGAPTAKATEPVIGLVRDARTSGLHAAMLFCAGMSALGSVVAWSVWVARLEMNRARQVREPKRDALFSSVAWA
ncbi:MAG: hypothetical protein HC933_05955 [Pleurocapsa sp. SU_196_0]|nr:hypothetical protein [Pleurocapsa sp. SU_196_0]